MSFDQYKYIQEYTKEHYDQIKITAPKGTKEYWKQLAKESGLSVSAYVMRAVDEYATKK